MASRSGAAGSNRDGCAIREQWSAANGERGESLTSYDPASKSWRQHWIETDGMQSDYVGGVDGKDVVMTAPGIDDAGKPIQHRMRFTPLPDGRVRQFIEDSSNGGASWAPSFDGYYSKTLSHDESPFHIESTIRLSFHIESFSRSEGPLPAPSLGAPAKAHPSDPSATT